MDVLDGVVIIEGKGAVLGVNLGHSIVINGPLLCSENAQNIQTFIS